MPGRFDVVFHVADEQRFVRLKIIFGEEVVDLLPLVPDIGVGLLKKAVEVNHASLHGKMVGVDRT